VKEFKSSELDTIFNGIWGIFPGNTNKSDEVMRLEKEISIATKEKRETAIATGELILELETLREKLALETSAKNLAISLMNRNSNAGLELKKQLQEAKEETIKCGKQIDHLRADVNELVGSNKELSARWKVEHDRYEAIEHELRRMGVAYRDYKAHTNNELIKVDEKSKWFDDERDKLIREKSKWFEEVNILQDKLDGPWIGDTKYKHDPDSYGSKRMRDSLI